MATFKRHDATSMDALPPSTRPAFRQEPARAPTVESDVIVPVLRSCVTGLCVAGCTAGVVLAVGIATPFAFAGLAGGVAATGWWIFDVVELRRLLWRVEENIGRDIDGDNQVGQPAPPVDNIVPVFHGPSVSAVDVPEPPLLDEGDRLIRLRPSERTIRKRVLWSYLLEAFMSGDWTRDGCRDKNINTKEWALVRDFVSRWPDVWATDDRPTLEYYLRSIGWTGPNRTEPNEPNEPNESLRNT